VAEVAGLSLLHVTHASHGQGVGHYRLGDTAATSQREGGRQLRSRRPWGLALPLADHLIDFLPDLDGVEPRVTGLDRLSIGQTFVVGLSAMTSASAPTGAARTPPGAGLP
jgi:hypothetical protein